MENKNEEKKPTLKKEDSKKKYTVLQDFTLDRQYVRSEVVELEDSKETKKLLTNKFIK